MKPGCSCVFFGVTNLLRLQMTKNTWLMRFIERSVVFRRVHQFVEAAALTTKPRSKFIYNNGNNASTDNITAGVAA